MVVPDLRFLLAALISGGFAAALVGLVVAARGVTPTPARPPGRAVRLLRVLRRPGVGGRFAGGVVTFAGVLVVTRWPVAAAAVGVLVGCWPVLFGGQRAERAQTARLEALVVWTESLRDMMSGHASLEQAVPATVVHAPPVLRPALTQLVGQLRARVPLDRALLQFAAVLDDPSADLVLAALILSVRRRGDRLGEVLTGLAVAAREELELRRRVTAGRAEIRRGVRIIIGITVGFGVFLAVFGGTYVRPYDTVTGQVMLTVVCGIFATAFLWMRKLAGAEPVQPFLARPGATPDPADAHLVATLTGPTTPASPPATTTPDHGSAVAGSTGSPGAPNRAARARRGWSR